MVWPWLNVHLKARVRVKSIPTTPTEAEGRNIRDLFPGERAGQAKLIAVHGRR